MARHPRWEEEEPSPPRRGRRARVRYLFLIAFSVLLILYVTAQVMARTDGFRELAAHRLEARLGLPVKIEDSSVNWRFDLTLRNLVTEGTKRPESPGLRARRIQLDWSLRDLWRGGPGLRAVELDRCVVVFSREASGVWAPAEFQPLSELLGRWLEIDLAPSNTPATAAAAGDEDRAKDEKGGRSWNERFRDSGIRFHLQQGEVTWWDGASAPRAAVKGVDVQVTPVSLPGRSLTHLRLAVAEAAGREGETVRNLRVEVLDLGERKIVLDSVAERHPAPLR